MNFEKLAALGAQGAAGGIIAAWLGFVWLIRPVATGGIDQTSWVVASVATFVLFGSLAGAHLYLGAQLRRPGSTRTSRWSR